MATIQRVYPDQKGFFSPVVTGITVNEEVIFDTAGWDSFTLQMVKNADADLTSLVLKVQKSNDGCNPVDFASAVTQSTEGMTAKQEVTAVGFVHAVVTTAGTSGYITLHARVQRNR